jgi:hypothetical protein
MVLALAKQNETTVDHTRHTGQSAWSHWAAEFLFHSLHASFRFEEKSNARENQGSKDFQTVNAQRVASYENKPIHGLQRS